jgi:hypothetical protein
VASEDSGISTALGFARAMADHRSLLTENRSLVYSPRPATSFSALWKPVCCFSLPWSALSGFDTESGRQVPWLLSTKIKLGNNKNENLEDCSKEGYFLFFSVSF